MWSSTHYFFVYVFCYLGSLTPSLFLACTCANLFLYTCFLSFYVFIICWSTCSFFVFLTCTCVDLFCVYYLFTFSFPFYRFWSIGGNDQRSVGIKFRCFLLPSNKVYVCFTTLIKLLFYTFDLCLYQSTLSPFWFVLVLIYSFTLLACAFVYVLLAFTLSLCQSISSLIPFFHGSFKNSWSFPSLHLYRLRSMQGASKSSLTVNTHIDTY